MNQSMFYCNGNNDDKKHKIKKKENNCDDCCYQVIPGIGPTGATGATGTSQIIEHTIIETTSINSILTVRNPADNSTALTITPLAGGTEAVSAHLVIIQIA